MLARNALPAADATRGEHQAALERLAADLRADVALFGADRVPLASVGKPLPAPGESRESGGWVYAWGSRPVWAVRLPDGRWLEARMPREGGFPGYRIFLMLALLALAVGVGAYPLARRLTRRLERLQAGGGALGAGELLARRGRVRALRERRARWRAGRRSRRSAPAASDAPQPAGKRKTPRHPAYRSARRPRRARRGIGRLRPRRRRSRGRARTRVRPVLPRGERAGLGPRARPRAPDRPPARGRGALRAEGRAGQLLHRSPVRSLNR